MSNTINVYVLEYFIISSIFLNTILKFT